MGNELAAAVDELVGTSVAMLSDAALRAEVLGLRRELDRLEHRYAEVLAAFSRRALAWADGSPSTAAWVQSKTGQSWRDAKHALDAGEVLTALPLVDKAWAQGEISTSAAAEIAAGRRDAFGDVYGELESVLVGFAANRQWRELRACIAAYRANCDALEDREPSDLNGAMFSKVGGRWALNGDFDDLGGSYIDRGLKSAMGAPAAGDDRTTAKRRADAIVEVFRYFLDHGELPLEDGRSPHLTLGFDIAFAMAGVPCARVRIWDGPMVSTAQLHELICESNIGRLVLGADSIPLDMGRDVRDASRAQRRAAARRDGGCRFPGCDRLAWRCHPHHVRWWHHDGPTDIGNLVLLCAFHHHVVHRTGWGATFDGVVFTVLRDGEVVGQTVNQGLPPPDRTS